jgi:hypothetical protein
MLLVFTPDESAIESTPSPVQAFKNMANVKTVNGETQAQ